MPNRPIRFSFGSRPASLACIAVAALLARPAFSADGKVLASGSDDQTIILWAVED